MGTTLRYFILLFLSFFNFLFSTLSLDLEENPDPFILDVQQIHIPKYPDAFNPSIVRYQDSILLAFRIRDPILKTTHQIGLIKLNEKFQPISKPYVLEIRNYLAGQSMAQDPRIITIGNELFMAYNDMLGSPRQGIRRMLIGKIEFDGKSFFIENPEMLTHFDQENKNRHEKNWAPFVYEEQLMLIYSLQPHTILKPLSFENKCETLFNTETNTSWDYGELRGGSQAFLVGDEYLSFFHSTKEIKTLQSEGKKMSHYFMGAYTFEKDPPHAIKSISKKPIIGKNFYNGPSHKTWKPLRVVFPGGFIFDDQYIFVAYGRQDHEIWIVKIDRDALLTSLTRL